MRDAGLYIATVLIWGASWIGIKWQVGTGVVAEHAILYRYAGAALIVHLLILAGRRSARASLRAHLLCAVMGVFMFGINYVLVYTAIGMGLTTALAAVVFSLLILMNALNTAIFYGERPGRGAVLAAPLGLAGMGCLFWRDIETLAASGEFASGPALLLCLGAVYCASIGNMVSRKLQTEGVNVMAANGWAMTYAALALLVWGVATEGPLTFSADPGFLISLALLTVFSTVVAFWAYLTLLGRIGADRAAYAFVAFPAVALAISSVVEDFVWTEARIAGVSLVLAGNIVLLAGPKAPAPPRYQGGGGAPALRLARAKTPGA